MPYEPFRVFEVLLVREAPLAKRNSDALPGREPVERRWQVVRFTPVYCC
jgi:hypothetical protein